MLRKSIIGLRYLAALLCFSLPAFAVDVTVTAASVVPSAKAIYNHGTCGGTITVGQAIYQDVSGTTYTLKAANIQAVGGSVAAARVVGIAVSGCAVNQEATFVTSDPDFTPGGTVAAGTVYTGGSAAGTIAPAADLATGDFTNVIGIGKANNKMYLKPFAGNTAHN